MLYVEKIGFINRMFYNCFDIPAATRRLSWRELQCLLHLILGQYVVAVGVWCGLWAEVDTPCTYGYWRSDVTADSSYRGAS